jgi:signal transduction histidine kinase
MYENIDFEKAKEFYIKEENLSTQLNWNQGIYLFAIGMSHTLVREGLIDSAITINMRAFELAKKENNAEWIGKIAYSIGNAYLLKQWYETALEYYLQALALFEKTGNTGKIADTYFQLTSLYANLDMVDKAIEYGEKSVALNKDDPYSLIGLARAYFKSNQYEKVNTHLEKALELCIAQKNTYLAGLTYCNLCDNNLILNNLAIAEKYAHQAIKINKEIGNSATYAGALAVLGKLEQLKGNFTQAEIYVNEALEIVNELENLNGQNFCYLLLSELSVAQYKFRKNIEYWKEWELVKNKIANETTLRTVGEMEAKYESDKKQLEIEKQKQIIKNQNLQRNLFAGGISFCVIIVALLWYLLRLRNRKNCLLTEINATKDKFFTIISHDLKNPAIAQRDAIQQLINNVSVLDSTAIAQYLNEILSSAEGEVELLYNLLNWAQVQTGRMVFTPTTFNLNSCLRPEIALIKEMAKHKEITFSYQMPEEAMITADNNMIATILRNLLTNAVKFTPKGGTVTLEITPCTDAINRPSTANRIPHTAKHLRISISDTGIGMTAQQIGCILVRDAARNISTRGTANETGTGLGLIVCKEMLEKHGSELHIESEEGKGSRFWFELTTNH